MAKYAEANQKKIFTEVTKLSGQYITHGVEILERLPFYQFKTIKMCEYYANSRYLTNRLIDGGNYGAVMDAANIDDIGREKPFYNIVNYRVTLAKVATAIHVRDIQIVGDEPKDWVKAMFLQREAYEWMMDPEVNFSYFLNKATYTRPKYGGLLVKKTETESGKLLIEVVDWRLVVTDQVDILTGVIIERHFMTPVELSKMGGAWNQQQVTAAIKAAAKLKQRKQRGYEKTIFNSERIEVQEVHGEFPIAYLKDANADLTDGEDTDENEEITEADNWNYSRQRYFISTVGNERFVFLAEEEKENPYDYLAWEEMPGRALGKGVIEDCQEAQVWTNDSIISKKNALDLAGKVVLTTDDPNMPENILTVDNGKMFNLQQGKSLNVLKLDPAALTEFDDQVNVWAQQANFATSSFSANLGSGNSSARVSAAQTSFLNQIANRPFESRQEEMSVWLSVIFDKWIIPYLIKQISSCHVLTSEFNDEELAIIDHSFGVTKANEKVINHVIKTGKVPSPDEYSGLITTEKSALYGGKRAIEFPEDYFDDIECSTTVNITDEQKDTTKMLASLSQILQDVSSTYNPQTGKFMVLEDPVLAKIFGNIVELSGLDISPTSLGIDAFAKPTPPPPPAQNPQIAPVASRLTNPLQL